MLADCTVLELGGRLGWLAGRILADLGADVIRVERPEGVLEDPEWRAFNAGKRVLRLDVASARGREVIETMIAGVDILIETARPGSEQASWLDPGRLAGEHPRLIQVSVTPFGRTGPRAAWKGSDIEMMAASGAMSLAGEPDGAPLRVSVAQSYCWAGSYAAMAALVAWTARRGGGGGQHADVSAQAAILAALAHAPTFVDLAGNVPTRAGSRISGRSVHGGQFRAFWPCRDGYLNFVLYGGPAGQRTNRALVAWMRERGAELGALAGVDWASFDPKLATQAEIDALERPIAAFFAGIGKREFLDEACRREMLGYPVFDVADIAADPQLEARRFWADLERGDGRRERHCGVFYMLDGERPAPAAGGAESARGGLEILAEFGFSEAEIDAVAASDAVRAA